MKKRIVSVIVLTAMTMPVAFSLANNYIGENISVASEVVEQEEYVSMYNSVPPSEAKDTDIVNIPDEDLKSAIEYSLGRKYGNTDNSEITVGDMKSLHYLSGTIFIGSYSMERTINSLEGLQYATNLTSIEIAQGRRASNKDISSETGFLKPISNIPKLERLRIRSSNVTSPDLKYLSKNLKELRIDKSKITDLSYLSSLENLKSLDLSGNYIKNAEPLKGLTKLEALIINDNQIGDISFLGELKSLRKLDISNNILESKRIDDGMDISILSELEGLIVLSAHSNGITDISSLANLKLLNTVDLYNNRISNIEMLKDSNSLGSWNLSSQNVQLILKDGNNAFKSPIIDINSHRAKLSDYKGFKSLGNDEYEIERLLASDYWNADIENIYFSGELEVINKNALEKEILSAKKNPTVMNINNTLQSLKDLKTIDITGELEEWINSSVEELESMETYPDLLGFDYYEPYISTGEKIQLKLNIYPDNATNKDVEWSSSDKEVASVDASGNVKGLSEGKATITAKVKGTDISTKAEITVKKGKEAVPVTDVKAKSVRLNASSAELKKDDTYQLRATVNPVNSTHKDIEWSTTNDSVATVDSNGLVKAVGEGKATIKARVKGTEVSATAAVTVMKVETPEVKAESIELDASKVDMQVEEKEKLTATVKPDKAINKEVEWSSSDENVVRVDSEGNLEAVGAGTAKVTAKVKGTELTAEAEIVVTEIVNKPVDTAADFKDINNHWAKENIENAFERGLFKGITETLFSPDTTMTRGMFVTVLGRLADETAEPNDKFSDVNSEAYYAEYVAWAEENEIVEGYGNGVFGPDNNVTREEMAAIIQRYMDYKGIELEDNDTEEFRDTLDISDWAKESVIKIQRAGIIEGKGNGVFDPQANSTRAEVATLLISIIEKYID